MKLKKSKLENKFKQLLLNAEWIIQRKYIFLYISNEAINILNYMILKIYRIYCVNILKYCTIHKVLPLFIYYMQDTLYAILH